MVTNDTSGRRLLVGDEVRMVPNTLFWAGRYGQQKRTGHVTQLVNDGTALRRITVTFEGDDPSVGVDESLFEKVQDSAS